MMTGLYPTRPEDLEELVRSLVLTITELSHTREEAEYWAAGVIDRLRCVDWNTQFIEKKSRDDSWLDAWRSKEEERNNEAVVCEKCGRMLRRADSVRLENIPKYRYASLCTECADSVVADYQLWENRTYLCLCQVCQTNHTARHPDQGTYLCEACDNTFHRRELHRVRSHLRRAREAGLEATLTLAQWLQTIDNFSGLCAYCQLQPFQAIEHFVPISQGGGTTIVNCIPVCNQCNSQKNKQHPDHSSLPFRNLHVLT